MNHERYIDGQGLAVRVHTAESCIGEHCVIHNPSDHPLAAAPTKWNQDLQRMERICEHGFIHPDPDSINAARILKGPLAARQESIHGCDGCCQPPTSDSEITE